MYAFLYLMTTYIATFFLQGGVGIELWTMTEDILFDNIYIGHSIDDAKAFAAETFDIKKPLESAADKAATPDEDDSETPSFKEDPIAFIRQRVLDFVGAAKLDPLMAFKTQPETGAALAAALFTLFGMLGALLSLVGGSQKPVITKVSVLSGSLGRVLSAYDTFSHRKRQRLLPTARKKRLFLWHLLARTRRRKTVASRSVPESRY